MCVVIGHCNLAEDFPAEILSDNLGLLVVNFISRKLMPMCIPIFFFLSGYLFFWNCDTFDSKVYFRKLRSRVTTLLVPYLIWCTVCAVIMYFKCRFLDFPGRGIFLPDNKIEILNFIKGYWIIPEGNGLPFAGAFWFIRNLMVMILLSPVFWFIGRRWWLTLAVFIGCLIVSSNFYCSMWFMLGASAGCHHIQRPVIERWQGLISAVLAVGITLVTYLCFKSFVLFVLACGFTAVVIMWVAQGVARHMGDRIVSTAVNATFFIYAFHQCFCFRIHKLWIHLIGIRSFWSTMATYATTFVSILVICLAFYVLLRRYAPRLLSIITGGRR